MVEGLLKAISPVKDGQRYILGIDGLSRSGKTTIVHKISEHLQKNNIPVCIFHMDDYIVERKRRYHTGNEEWYEYYYLQWDVEWLENNMFNKLKVTEELSLPIYDNSTDTHQQQVVKLPETCLIIVEGVFLQRIEWRRYFDYLMYIDSPRIKRFKRERRNTQSNLKKFRNRYWKAENYYIKTEAPKEQADVILKN